MFGIMDRVIRTATRRQTPEETRFEKEMNIRLGSRKRVQEQELEQNRAARTRFWI